MIREEIAPGYVTRRYVIEGLRYDVIVIFFYHWDAACTLDFFFFQRSLGMGLGLFFFFGIWVKLREGSSRETCKIDCEYYYVTRVVRVGEKN